MTVVQPLPPPDELDAKTTLKPNMCCSFFSPITYVLQPMLGCVKIHLSTDQPLYNMDKLLGGGSLLLPGGPGGNSIFAKKPEEKILVKIRIDAFFSTWAVDMAYSPRHWERGIHRAGFPWHKTELFWRRRSASSGL